MSQFYARYTPPSTKPNGTLTEPTSDEDLKTKAKPALSSKARDHLKPREQKRKREEGIEGPRKYRKRRNDDDIPKTDSPNAVQSGKNIMKAVGTDSSNILNKYSVSKAARFVNLDVEVRRPKKKPSGDEEKPPAGQPAQPVPTKTKKRDKKQNSNIGSVEEAEENLDGSPQSKDENSKHASILSKFAKSRENAVRMEENPTDVNALVLRGAATEEKMDLHGLEPLPQPEQVEVPLEKPSYSTLPQWLANPTLVPPNSEVAFKSLGVSREAVTILRDNGIEKAFSIQSTVIPLLCDGARRHRGDLCISAATGSGKTLAYVLPMVESLKRYVTTKLRGLIVVPTRELVRQARATCDMCAVGTSLKIATALGTKAIADEQHALITVEEVYDPAAYRQEQQRQIDWSTYSMDKIFDRVLEEDELDCIDRVKRYNSKVDILICTPGRLVDHLRSTTGFSLDDVTWVVIDEADRLLNESYQEWIEVVMPALESRKSAEVRDEVLQHMRLDVPPRQITKVALSATMTQDISKLDSLGLHNPKMVVLGASRATADRKGPDSLDPDDEPLPDAEGAFNLPDTLTESAILVGDGAEKPLFLLELLRSRIRPSSKESAKNAIMAEVSFEKRSSSSSSESDLSSDSDSDLSSSYEFSNTLRGSATALKGNSLPNGAVQNTSRALIFTRSSESAARLSRLLSILDPSLSNNITTLTRSSTSSTSSRKAMSSFLQGKTALLIATDRASRGLDVPDLEHVISYDVPASASTYVHRVGRTARAGKAGNAWTLLAHREGRWFWKEIGKGEGIRRNGKVARVVVSVEDEGLKWRYEDALKRLGEEVKGS